MRSVVELGASHLNLGSCSREGHSKEIRSVMFLSDGSRLITSLSDRTVRVWDMQTAQGHNTLECQSESITNLRPVWRESALYSLRPETGSLCVLLLVPRETGHLPYTCVEGRPFFLGSANHDRPFRCIGIRNEDGKHKALEMSSSQQHAPSTKLFPWGPLSCLSLRPHPRFIVCVSTNPQGAIPVFRLQAASY